MRSGTLLDMRVSAKADYALRALIEMGARGADGAGQAGDGGRPVSAEELGRLQGIPHNFLQAILADLRRSGIVLAQRGQSGGWRLAKPAATVTVADVIRAVDGPLVSVYGLRPEAVTYNERADALQRVWIAARHSLRDVFEQVSVADLVAGALPARRRPPHRGRGRLAAALRSATTRSVVPEPDRRDRTDAWGWLLGEGLVVGDPLHERPERAPVVPHRLQQLGGVDDRLEAVVVPDGQRLVAQPGDPRVVRVVAAR